MQYNDSYETLLLGFQKASTSRCSRHPLPETSQLMAARSVVTLSLAISFSTTAITRQVLRDFNYPACSSSKAHWFHPPASSWFGTMPAPESHSKALTSPYPGSRVTRSQVPADKVSWLQSWPQYQPVEFTAPPVLAGPVWADPEIGTSDFSPKFNQLDGKVQRKSLIGTYEVVDGRPRNPIGRTGLIGRGLLGRWGPNHAADPIITRWKRNSAGEKVSHVSSGKNILEFVAIKRIDCGEWAIPGGMVDPGEKIGATLKREFGEEALNAMEKTSAEREVLEKQLNLIFSQEEFEVYKGYVDDPRNTDNAWMETKAVNYHDHTGAVMDNIPLEAGDDAGKVKWVAIGEELSLYASHAYFIQLVANKLDAHWG
ncbi:ADP-ribose pyrophosphatase, mitochondrial isoform X2 [Ambystoma mexicanum]|uniref:ADP-ribose pyrophosphatase, mitochondrial isoform X2 n=1 Tax=Ambystoma mexicanum TaxID=8296 RepID=UPI0037E9C073